jgi:HK97 family phage major capsid protein
MFKIEESDDGINWTLVPEGKAATKKFQRQVPDTDAMLKAFGDKLGGVVKGAVEASEAKVIKLLDDKIAAIPAARTKATSHTNGIADAAAVNDGDPDAFNPDEDRSSPAFMTKTYGAPAKRDIFTGRTVRDASQGGGVNFARLVKGQAVAKMDSRPLDEVLKGWGYKYVADAFKHAYDMQQKAIAQLRALGQNVLQDGGAVVPVEFSSEFIPLLRNQVAVRQLGARVIQMASASMTIARQNAAGSAAYSGENTTLVPSQQKLGNLVLNEKKLTAGTAISNDLIRNAAISAEEMVRDDLVLVVALKEDSTFMFGTGANDSPRGIEALIDSAYLYTMTATDAKNPSLAEIKRELAKEEQFLKNANIPRINTGRIISPRTEAYLASITDGLGNSIYEKELAAGMLKGRPVVVTNQIAENLDGTTDASRIIFGDFAQALIGESMAMQVDVFPNGAYDNGSGTVISGASLDQTFVRVIEKHDFNLRYSKAFTETKTRMGAP